MNQENPRPRSLFEEPAAKASAEQPVVPKHPSLSWKLLPITGVILLVGALLTLKNTGTNPAHVGNPATADAGVQGLPSLLDLGSTTSIPCRMMAPILEELQKEYKGRLNVRVVDVNRDPAAGREYAISVIPTQIFFDASGKELWRHEGFISKQDILAKWTELGFNFEKGASRDEPR